jgi:DNA-binding response OmpR family regulator
MKDRGRILVIDDSTTVRKLVEISFRGTTTAVEFASSGAEGVRHAIAQPPDVILLDFVLPDMRGVDVCARLAMNPGTAAVPVVVMSAKREGVKDAFRVFPSVVDVIVTPFGMDEIRARIGAAMNGRAPSTMPAMPAGSLQPVPVPVGHGATPVPIAHSASSPVQVSRAPSSIRLATTDVMFSGDLSTMPLIDALRFVSTLQLTGCLTIEIPARHDIYTRDGDVILCASAVPPSAADLDHVDLARVPRAAVERASQEQVRTGKPALASLAEAGYVPRAEVPLMLREQGSRSLAAAFDAKAGPIYWRTQAVLPDYVEAFGRPQAVTGIALERSRRARANEAVPAGFLDAIYERTPRFSHKLAGARLSASEQKLLALFDGQTPMCSLLERTGIPLAKAASVCNRLRAVDLIELRDHASAGTMECVALWTPDDGELEPGLRALLQRRAPPIEVVDLTLEADLPAAILRMRPRLILVAYPSPARTELIVDAARMISSALVAVLDTASRAAIDACLAAGFHSVLVKPIHLNDLERLMSAWTGGG